VAQVKSDLGTPGMPSRWSTTDSCGSPRRPVGAGAADAQGDRGLAAGCPPRAADGQKLLLANQEHGRGEPEAWRSVLDDLISAWPAAAWPSSSSSM